MKCKAFFKNIAKATAVEIKRSIAESTECGCECVCENMYGDTGTQENVSLLLISMYVYGYKYIYVYIHIYTYIYI